VCRASSASTAAAAGVPARSRANGPSASHTGRYGSPVPYCSKQWPASTATPAARVPAANAPDSAVLPLPGSPDRNTTCRRPAAAAARHAPSRASSPSRPTTRPAVLAANSATVAGVSAA
jgi:hypothetical protein